MPELIIRAALIAVVLAISNGQVKIDETGKEGLQKMTFKTPNLTEEESHSHFLPAALKCDACRIIAYQFHKKFTEFNARQKQYKFKLPESEVIELVEAVCDHDTFKSYGIKQIDSTKRLSGEGLETADLPGVIGGGGRWPGRLSEMCLSFNEELSEDGIYQLYVDNKDFLQKFEDKLCRGEGLFGECNKNKNKKSKSNKRKSHTEL